MKQRQSRAERLGDDIGENGRRAGNFCRFFSRICGAAAKKPKRTKCKEEFFFIFPPETLRFFAAAENKSQERNAEQNGLSKHSHEVARISFKANETKNERVKRREKGMDNFYKKPTKENPYAGLWDGKWLSISEALNEMVRLLESDVISKEVKVSIIPTAHELCERLKTEVFFDPAQKK